MKAILMVKKRLENGEPCAKCVQAEEMLRARGVWDRVSEVVWADERDPSSVGMQIAREHDVKLAPFFVVTEEDGQKRIVTSTLKLIKELGGKRGQRDGDSPALVEPPSPGELAEIRTKLAGKSPADVLGWGLERYGPHLSIAFSGAEDVVLIDMNDTIFCIGV